MKLRYQDKISIIEYLMQCAAINIHVTVRNKFAEIRQLSQKLVLLFV